MGWTICRYARSATCPRSIGLSPSPLRPKSGPAPQADRHDDMTAQADKQWRIDNASHLKGVRLRLRYYTRWSESWDHAHCAACWAKFAEFEGPDIQHEGYATCEDYPRGACYEWICKTCFADLRYSEQGGAAGSDRPTESPQPGSVSV